MPSSYIIGRVSHKSSGQSGLSEAGQYTTCKEFISNVLTKVPLGQQCYPDGNAPGYFFDRAHTAWRIGFNQRPAAFALNRVLKRGDHVVTYSIDRCFRSVKAFCDQIQDWEKRGIYFHSVTENLNFDTAEGKMMARMLAVFAEYYSDLISERTKEAVAIKRLTGKPAQSKAKDKWQASEVYMSSKPEVNKLLKPGRVFMYNRCSHIDSQISGLGMEAQRSGNLKYAERLISVRMGMALQYEPYEDESISAFSVPFSERPAGKQLLEIVQPGDVIIVYRLDRMFRNVGDAVRVCEALAAKDIAIHIVQSGIDTLSIHGQMMLAIFTAFANFESSFKSRRIKEAMQAAKAQGRPLNREIPRYSRVARDRATGHKKLVYDYSKMTDIATVYLCRFALDMTIPQSSDVINAIHCSRTKTKPLRLPWRKPWNMKYTQRSANDFIALRDKLPPSAIESCLVEAITALTTEIDPVYLTCCSPEFPVPRAMERIQDHLDAVGISLPLSQK